MSPFEFITIATNNDFNTPAGEIAEAMSKPLIITDGFNDYQVLGYYYDKLSGQMVIDIERSITVEDDL